MKRTLNLLYDQIFIDRTDKPAGWAYHQNGYATDIYSSHFIPINFSNQEAYIDYHISIKQLINKYHPEVEIRPISIDELKTEDPFVYIISFKNLFDYAKKKHLATLFDDLDAKIVNGLKNEIGYVILNDSHEYANYLEIFDELKLLNKFKDQILIASSNLDNGNYKGTSKSLVGGIMNPVISGYSKIKQKSLPEIYGFRYFEEACALQTKTFYKNYDYNQKASSLNENPSSAVLCLNNVNKDFRTVISYLIFSKCYEKSTLSQKVIPPNYLEVLNTNGWAPLIEEGSFVEFESQLPIKADNYRKDINNPWNIVPWDLINKCFLWLVTETLFEGSGLSRCYFTEKTYKPMSLFMPFILVGQPHSLYNLRKEGYQTFEKFWDESYDLEVNKVKRIKKIMTVVIELCRKNESDLLKMYEDMRPVLEHNYHQLLNSQSAKPFIDRLVSKYYEQN